MTLLDYLEVHPELNDVIMGLPEEIAAGLMFNRKDDGTGKFVIDDTSPKSYFNEQWIDAAVKRAISLANNISSENKREADIAQQIKDTVAENMASTAKLDSSSSGSDGILAGGLPFAAGGNRPADEAAKELAEVKAKVAARPGHQAVVASYDNKLAEEEKKRLEAIEAAAAAREEDEKKKAFWANYWQELDDARKAESLKNEVERKQELSEQKKAAATQILNDYGLDSDDFKELFDLANTAIKGLDYYDTLKPQEIATYTIEAIKRKCQKDPTLGLQELAELSSDDWQRLYAAGIDANDISISDSGILRNVEHRTQGMNAAVEEAKGVTKENARKKRLEEAALARQLQFEMLRNPRAEFGAANTSFLGSIGKGTKDSPYLAAFKYNPEKNLKGKNAGRPVFYVMRQRGFDGEPPLFDLTRAIPRRMMRDKNNKSVSFEDSGLPALGMNGYFVPGGKPVSRLLGYIPFLDKEKDEDPTKHSYAFQQPNWDEVPDGDSTASDNYRKGVQDYVNYISNIITSLGDIPEDRPYFGLSDTNKFHKSEEGDTKGRDKEQLAFDKAVEKAGTFAKWKLSRKPMLDTKESQGKTVAKRASNLSDMDYLRDLYRFGWQVSKSSGQFQKIGENLFDDPMPVEGVKDTGEAGKKFKKAEEAEAKFIKEHPEYEGAYQTMEIGSRNKGMSTSPVLTVTKKQTIPAVTDAYGREIQPAQTIGGKVIKKGSSWTDSEREALGKKTHAEASADSKEVAERRKEAVAFMEELFPGSTNTQATAKKANRQDRNIYKSLSAEELGEFSPEAIEELTKSWKKADQMSAGYSGIVNDLMYLTNEDKDQLRNIVKDLSDRNARLSAVVNFASAKRLAYEHDPDRKEGIKENKDLRKARAEKVQRQRNAEESNFERAKVIYENSLKDEKDRAPVPNAVTQPSNKEEKESQPDNTEEKKSQSEQSTAILRKPGQEPKEIKVNKNVADALLDARNSFGL